MDKTLLIDSVRKALNDLNGVILQIHEDMLREGELLQKLPEEVDALLNVYARLTAILVWLETKEDKKNEHEKNSGGTTPTKGNETINDLSGGLGGTLSG
jgi:hypothetical protein